MEEAKRRGLKPTPENVEEFLKTHGYYFFRNEGEMRQNLKKERNPTILIASPTLFQLLGVTEKSGNILPDEQKIPEVGEIKPISYLSEAKIRFRASLIAYDVAKRLFGKKLSAFAVVGGTLTQNIVGVPVKVRDVGSGEVMAHIGVVDDLDLLILLENAKPEDQECFLAEFERELKRRRMPRVFIDNSRPFVLSPEQKKELTHFLHDLKPRAVYKGREYLERLIKDLKKDPETKKELEKEMEEYRKKLRLYTLAIEQKLKQTFERAMRQRIRSKKMWKIARLFEEVYRLVDSSNVKELLENLMLQYQVEMLKNKENPKGITVHNLKLRYAATLTLLQYLFLSGRAFDLSKVDILKYYPDRGTTFSLRR